MTSKDEEICNLQKQLLVLQKQLEVRNKAIDDNLIYSETNLAGVITYVSKVFEQISGYSKFELLGQPHNMVRDPGMPKEVFKEIWETIPTGKAWNGIVRNRAKDGSYYTFQATIGALYDIDDKIVGYFSSRHDITNILRDKKRVETILNYQSSIVLIRYGNDIKNINNIFFKIFGFKDLDDFKSKHKCICELFINKGEQIPHLVTNMGELNWLEYIDQNKDKYHNVYMLDKNNKERVYEVKTSGKIFEEEEEEEEVIVFTDITDLKQQQQSLLKQAEHLSIANLKVNESLRKEKIAKKAKDMFLANMSHDIRTPLNGIVATLDLVKKTQLNQMQKQYIDICKNSSDMLLAIVDDILDLSKLETGKFELHPQKTNIKKELKTISNMFDTQISQKGLKFELNIDKNLPDCIVCDIKRLKQVFMNLLSNAIKFTSDGFVIFDIQLIKKDTNQATIKFIIEDTGIGIATEHQKKIFEPFKQEDSTTSIKFGGTGLGTSIAKNIVELHESKLELDSELGSGSRFYFTATFDICGQFFEEEEEEEEEACFENSTILIAEDNETNQMVIEMLLEDLEIEDIAITNNGLEAFEEYRENYDKYDLILMDVNMPVLDGLGATKKILEFEKSNQIEHTAIIALTANTVAGDRQKFLDSGMDGYLAKPIKEHELIKVLKGFLSA